MDSRLVIYPYKMASQAAKLLAQELDCKRVYPDRDYSPKKGDLIINWGNGSVPNWAQKAELNAIILNHWRSVNISIEKMDSFRVFKSGGVRIPQWTLNHSVARDWAADGSWVVCRTVTEGRDGQGIVLAKKKSEIVDAPLYTRYIPIFKEFRVYVFLGKTIDVLEKRRDSGALGRGEVNPDIRTERNHWVFCRGGVHIGDTKEAEKAIVALGLDFGGVDMVQSSEDQKFYVLETNTAPGIAGTTVAKFAEEIQKVRRDLLKRR